MVIFLESVPRETFPFVLLHMFHVEHMKRYASGLTAIPMWRFPLSPNS